MFLRFTYLHFPPEKREEAKAIYIAEVAPAIRQQQGNRKVLLLEPAEGDDAFISYSLWETEADIKNFEASDAYPSILGRIKALASQPPVQQYYQVHE